MAEAGVTEPNFLFQEFWNEADTDLLAKPENWGLRKPSINKNIKYVEISTPWSELNREFIYSLDYYKPKCSKNSKNFFFLTKGFPVSLEIILKFKVQSIFTFSPPTLDSAEES